MAVLAALLEVYVSRLIGPRPRRDEEPVEFADRVSPERDRTDFDDDCIDVSDDSFSLDDDVMPLDDDELGVE